MYREQFLILAANFIIYAGFTFEQSLIAEEQVSQVVITELLAHQYLVDRDFGGRASRGFREHFAFLPTSLNEASFPHLDESILVGSVELQASTLAPAGLRFLVNTGEPENHSEVLIKSIDVHADEIQETEE